MLSVYVGSPVNLAEDSVKINHNVFCITDRVSGLKFSTAAIGGFLSASFLVALPDSEVAWWYENFIGGHVTIYDRGNIAWEGRIETIGNQQFGISVNCNGYWSSLTDMIHYGFYSESRAGEFHALTKDDGVFAGLGAHIDLFPGFFGTFQGANILKAYPKSGVTVDDFCGFVWTFAPDVSGGNTPPDNIKRHIERIKFDYSNSSKTWIKVYTTDQPYSDALASWQNQVTLTGAGTGSQDLATVGSSNYAIAILLGCQNITGISETTSCEVKNLNFSAFAAAGATEDPPTAKTILRSLIALSQRNAFAVYDREPFLDNPGLEIIPLVVEGVTLQELISKLASYSESGADPREWLPAVWDGRYLWFRAKQTDSVHWFTSKYNLSDEGAGLERGLEGYWPELAVMYIDIDGRRKWTTEANSPVSVVPIKRRRLLQADAQALDIANAIRDAQFQPGKRPPQQASINLTGHVLNAVKAKYPLWTVRANQYIQISDLNPGSFISEKAGEVANPLKTFFIRETEYDYDSNTLTLTIEYPSTRLDILSARLSDLTFD